MTKEATTSGNEGYENIALALSGGGARAMAFHLGCLRRLHALGLLDRVTTISSVSGGSVIGALYCATPGGFGAFEEKVRLHLKKGFTKPTLRKAVTSFEGMRAFGHFLTLLADRTISFPARWICRGMKFSRPQESWPNRPAIHRSASRTTILRKVFDDVFEKAVLDDLRSDRPRLIMIACELRAKAAFYFTKDKLHCWRYGSASSSGVRISDGVVASAAYPLLLPAIDTTMEFEKDEVKKKERVTLTDGGVYDNLGLMPLWPGRDNSISLQVGPVGRIIACRAGYSLDVGEPAATIIPRMKATFESVFARAENAATKRLFDLQNAGKIPGFILPYLGQEDRTLKYPPADLVSEESVAGYPTNFDAMSDDWIDRLVLRGEQMVSALVTQHWPDYEGNG